MLFVYEYLYYDKLRQEIILIISLIYVPFLQFGFGTKGIYIEDWFVAIPFAVVIVCYDEGRKFLFRTLGKESWIYDKFYF